MFSATIQLFFASFIVTVMAQANGIVCTSASSAMTKSQAGYPPSGLLDSVHSMKAREELYQSELLKLAARELVVDPALSLPETNKTPTGILESFRILESFYRSLLIPEDDGHTTISLAPTITPSYILLPITTPPTSRPVPPSPPPEMTNYVTPQTSNAPQPHLLISIVWVLVISFIIGITLYQALSGLSSFILIFLVLNVVCALLVGANGQSHSQLHSKPHPEIEARRRPIGGLRPGPIGKIPCGPVRGRIGTKHGHGFVHGVDRKVGGLRPVAEELMCDDWSNAWSLFGRRRSMPPADPADDETVEKTTTIYTTEETTVWDTVEDTATETTGATTGYSKPTPFDALSSVSPSQTLTLEPKPTILSLSDLANIERESSAVPPVVNIRTSASHLFLLYLGGVFLCLLAGGTPGALGYVVISLAIIAVIGGAEAIAVPVPTGLHYSVGWRVTGVRPADAAKVRDSQEVTVWNGTHTITDSVESERLRGICGEVYCHNWPAIDHETSKSSSTEPMPTYADLAKRLSTEYVTITPTSGIIGIFGPQIIPVTVESTAYANLIVSTADVVRVRSTRTKVVTITTSEPAASDGILTMSKTDGMGGFIMTTPTAVPSDEVRTTIRSSSASEMSREEQIEVSTVSVTTTEAPLPASTVFVTTMVITSPSLASSSFSFASDLTSSSPTNELPVETPSPTSLPATSSASHLDPTQLYLFFVETKLYGFLLLFMGLQIALTTSHPLVFLGGMSLLMIGGPAAMKMCASGQRMPSGVVY